MAGLPASSKGPRLTLGNHHLPRAVGPRCRSHPGVRPLGRLTMLILRKRAFLTQALVPYIRRRDVHSHRTRTVPRGIANLIDCQTYRHTVSQCGARL